MEAVFINKINFLNESNEFIFILPFLFSIWHGMACKEFIFSAMAAAARCRELNEYRSPFIEWMAQGKLFVKTFYER